MGHRQAEKHRPEQNFAPDAPLSAAPPLSAGPPLPAGPPLSAALPLSAAPGHLDLLRRRSIRPSFALKNYNVGDAYSGAVAN